MSILLGVSLLGGLQPEYSGLVIFNFYERNYLANDE